MLAGVSKLDIATELTKAERSSVFITAALKYLEAQRGPDIFDELVGQLGLDRDAPELQRLFEKNSMNSYQLEAAIFESWLKYFDGDREQFRLLGKE